MNSEFFDLKNWVGEVHDDFAFFYRKKQELFAQNSSFQKVEVVETTSLGKALLNDGYFMVSERDEAHYHEMMVHVPVSVHPQVRRVLIIGGGDGGTAREVLRHSTVQSVIMVEIDGVVIEASRQHLSQTAIGLDDPRLQLIVGDGVEYLKACADDQFDLILIDSTDPIGPAAPLFGSEFYRNVNRCLKKDGIVIAQGESPYHNAEMQKKLIEVVSESFEIRTFYNFTNMTYPGGLWSFLYASHGQNPLQSIQKFSAECLAEMKYYSADVHRGAFALPEFQRRALSDWICFG